MGEYRLNKTLLLLIHPRRGKYPIDWQIQDVFIKDIYIYNDILSAQVNIHRREKKITTKFAYFGTPCQIQLTNRFTIDLIIVIICDIP